jgi:hypothetical protein
MALTIVGVFLFSMGLSGVVADCVRTHGFVIPSWNLFNLIAGVGLLKLWRGARRYALFMSGLCFLVALPMSVWAVFNPERIVFQFPEVLIDDRPHAVVPTFLVVLVLTGYVAISGWIVYVLMRRDVRELFQPKINSPVPSVSM